MAKGKTSWQTFWGFVKPVAVVTAAVFGFLGVAPKTIFAGIIVWQLLTRGGAIADAFVAIYNAIFNKDETEETEQ